MLKILARKLPITCILSLLTLAAHATDVSLQQVQANTPIQTQDAKLQINLTPQQSLPPGKYTFELVVTDDSGNQSMPVQAQVTVRDTTRPVAVLTTPQFVDVGKAIVLDASKSSDIGGKIDKYTWRLLAN